MEQGFEPPPTRALARSESRRAVLVTALLAFTLGAAIAGWLGWHGDLARLVARGAADPIAAAPARTPQASLDQMSALETRLALLEDRFSRIDLRADAASGNAARAEGLLVAYAARRMLDRGQPLGAIADQLRLRFANAQPRAVQTLTDFAAAPVTLDELDARLDALAPRIAGLPDKPSTWDRLRTELADLFTVRREDTAALGPEARVARAKLMLAAGRVDAAIAEVAQLPGAASASGWSDDARRYGTAQQALDLIETTAMLDPRRLQDGQGRRVDQPSPLAGAGAATPGT